MNANAPAVGGPHPPGFIHAVAIDYDGTLTETGSPAEATLAALAASRTGGVKVVLVTGRILSELRSVWPGVEDEVDLIVAENGAVVSFGGSRRLLAAPVPESLDRALQGAGVGFRRGEALLACSAQDEHEVLEAVRGLGLECQLIRNRGALMVLPAGVSKGTGLFDALGYLGISHHNTVAIGDAENDHSLLEAAEVGVAVGNAVDSLKASADLVLDRCDGAGVADLLSGPLMSGRTRIHADRWRIRLGTAPDGEPVWLPASQLNLLVTGSPRRGKSYLAGLIAEQLIGLRYSVVVLDPEGDHSALGKLRGALVVGDDGRLPEPEELIRLIAHRFSSVVVDLSVVPGPQRAAYLEELPAAIEAQRSVSGLPHWVIVDEAQDPLGRHGAAQSFLEPASRGYCLVTYRPDELCPEALMAVDALVALPGERDLDPVVGLAAATGSMTRRAARQLFASAGPGQAILVRREGTSRGQVFTVGPRHTGHLRHRHKYSSGKIAPDRRFYFRLDWDTSTGATAGNLRELDQQLRSCPESVLAHHCLHGDFSRWVADVLGDSPLASQLARTEAELRSGEVTGRRAREDLLNSIERRQDA